jgi:two-component system, NarL family, sensor kinase
MHFTVFGMQKMVYHLAVLLLTSLIISCKSSPTKDPRISQVNNWYARQNYFWQLNTDSVLHYATMIDSVAKNLPRQYKAMALVGRARYHLTKKTSLALKYYEQSLALLQDTGADSVLAKVHNGIGLCYIKRSDYSNALEHYFIALRLCEKTNDAAGISSVLANIGELYQVKGDINSAKKYIRRAMENSRQQHNMASYLDAAQTLANVYGMSNQFDSAIAIDRMGIIAADSMGSTKIKSAFYNNLGNCYLYSNQPDSARYYFMQCLEMDAANGLVHFMVDNYLTLGQLFLQQNERKKAEHYFKQAISLSDSINEKQFKAQAWKALSVLYKQDNNLAMALNAKDSAGAVKDRMISEKSENKIAELQELYETEKKEQMIALQQVKLSRQQLVLTASLILFASLIFSAWLLYRRSAIKKEKEMQATLMQQRESSTLAILQAEDQERRRIAAELHDGVGQVMLAAWINLQAMEPHLEALDIKQQESMSKAITMVGEGCKEVREVSHAMMPGALLHKGLAGALQDFFKQIDESVISIQFHADGLDGSIDNITASMLYRIIQECVNNTIRHAGATELDISLLKNESGISLQIEDNGKGFDVAVMQNNKIDTAGLGLQNIQSRIAFLQGTVEWDSSPGNGTVVTIFIPVKNKDV